MLHMMSERRGSHYKFSLRSTSTIFSVFIYVTNVTSAAADAYSEVEFVSLATEDVRVVAFIFKSTHTLPGQNKVVLLISANCCAMIWGCFSWSGLGTASQQSS